MGAKKSGSTAERSIEFPGRPGKSYILSTIQLNSQEYENSFFEPKRGGRRGGARTSRGGAAAAAAAANGSAPSRRRPPPRVGGAGGAPRGWPRGGRGGYRCRVGRPRAAAARGGRAAGGGGAAGGAAPLPARGAVGTRGAVLRGSGRASARPPRRGGSVGAPFAQALRRRLASGRSIGMRCFALSFALARSPLPNLYRMARRIASDTPIDTFEDIWHDGLTNVSLFTRIGVVHARSNAGT